MAVTCCLVTVVLVATLSPPPFSPGFQKAVRSLNVRLRQHVLASEFLGPGLYRAYRSSESVTVAGLELGAVSLRLSWSSGL